MDLKIINDYVKEQLASDHTGHDYLHIKRVLKNADLIIEDLELSKDDIDIIKATILVHDLSDYKLVDDVTQAEKSTLSLLKSAHAEDYEIERIMYIVRNMSYSSNIDGNKELDLLGQIVQDADRLDAIGAVGIARTFYYGGSKDSPMYTEDFQAKSKASDKDKYKKGSSVIDHYFEKLVHLKDLMNTEEAKKIASERHDFMKRFFEVFIDDIS